MDGIIAIIELIILILLYVANNASDVKTLGKSKFRNFFVYIKAFEKILLFAYLAFGVILYIKYIILKVVDFSSPISWILIVVLSLSIIILLRYYMIKYIKNIKNKNDTEYYREIPKVCSTAMASFLINQKLEKKKDLFSTIINLVSKKAIDIIPENKDYTYKQKEQVKLKEDEKYVYDWLFSKDKSNFSLSTWQDIVKKELITNNLIERKENNNYLYKTLVFIWFLLILTIGILSWRNAISEDTFESLIAIFLAPALIILPAFGMLDKMQIRFNEFILSMKGKAFYLKLKALKKFLKDFSIISERKSEEVYIWDEYLAFALVLNVNINYKSIKSLNMPLLTAIQEKELFEDVVNKLAQLGDDD